MSRIPMRIITADFELVAEVDNYETLMIESTWGGTGGICELKINRYMLHANELTKGRIIFPSANKRNPFIIKHREIELDENGKATENWIIKAVSLKGLLGQRITLPPSGQAYDYMNTDAESIMRGYVQRNAITPTDVRRAIPRLTQSANQAKGPTLIYQTRFKNLAEEQGELSLLSGLGWNIRLDTQSKKFVYDVLEGRNLTTDQNMSPPVIFSPKFNSLSQLSYTESELNYKNSVYVAGQGEGVERRVIEVGSSSGLERHELFVDARDVEEENRTPQDITNDLIARGSQSLLDYGQEQFMEGKVVKKSPFIYRRDYDLGDIVTIRNDDWGITMNSRITVIRQSYSANGEEVELVFDESQPTLIQVLKRALKQNNIELRR